jgi:Skp family chaperone for outer membrane proteins
MEAIMSKQIEHENPTITKIGVFDMQVCVPETWSNEEAEQFYKGDAR